MKKIFKNYKTSIILLGAIIIGGICGVIFKEKTSLVKPLGDLFLNMMFVIIVPLIFVTISHSIVKMENPKRLKKVILSIFMTFIIMSLVAVFLGVISTRITRLVNSKDSTKILEVLDDSITDDNELNILERTVSLISVSDFSGLLSKNNIIAILVMAIITGFAIRKSGTKGKKVVEMLDSLNEVILNILNIIMYYAPIGIGCYFASLVGTFGNEIINGYLRTFIIYTIVCLIVYIIIYPLYAYFSYGKKGIKVYLKNILPPTLMALSSCSSAASIPVNQTAVKKMGISSDIADTTVPLGTSFHKDGSIIGSVFKIMFLVCLFNRNTNIWAIIGVSLLATLLVSAVPIGGGTISEMLILTLLGFPLSALPILTIIATIIDPPATVLNVIGDTSASLIVSRMIDGKDAIS